MDIELADDREDINYVVITKGAAIKNKALTDFKKAIRLKYDLKERAFQENNVMGLVDGFYAKHALLVEDKAVVSGYEEVIKLYEGLVPTAESVGIKSYHTYLSGEGSVGYDYTTFHVDLVDGNEIDFKLLFIWEKIDGDWLCITDMYFPGKF